MMSFPVITFFSDIKLTVPAQTIALIQAISGSIVLYKSIVLPRKSQ